MTIKDKEFMELISVMLSDAGVKHLLVIKGEDGRLVSVDGGLSDVAYMVAELINEIRESMKE